MRKLFSQREGHKPVKSTLQVRSMEVELRSRLWDMVTVHYWNQYGPDDNNLTNHAVLKNFLQRLWHGHFKRPIDTIGWYWPTVLKSIRDYFFNCEWNEVYDFLEFMGTESPWTNANPAFQRGCNIVLEQEMSGYRFISDQITPITSEQEIAEIEKAASLDGKIAPVSKHLEQALTLLSDRKAPDYRNSIKESISAVEALCRVIGESPKATLGDALKKIEQKVKIHPALNQAFGKLYGYTNDADGIRHSLLDEPNLRFEDAKYMVITCSAFVNYLVAKAVESGCKF